MAEENSPLADALNETKAPASTTEERPVRAAVLKAFEKHGVPTQGHGDIAPDVAEIVNTERAPDSRARDDKGRFAPTAAEKAAEQAKAAPITDLDATAKPTAAVQTVGDAPAGWSAEGKSAWKALATALPSLPPEAQAAVAAVQAAAMKREETASNGSRQWSEEKRRYEETIAPIAEAARSRGIETKEAINRLLTAQNHLDRDAANAIRWLAQSYGVDLTQLAINPDYRAPGRQTPQPQQQPVDDRTIEQKVSEVIEQRELQREIADFAKNKPHFEAVKGHMQALLQSGAATDLEDAYDQAIWAKKDLRSQLLAEHAGSNTDPKQQEAAKVQKARSAAVSLKGTGSGQPVAAPKKFPTVRAAVLDAWNKHANGRA